MWIKCPFVSVLISELLEPIFYVKKKYFKAVGSTVARFLTSQHSYVSALGGLGYCETGSNHCFSLFPYGYSNHRILFSKQINTLIVHLIDCNRDLL